MEEWNGIERDHLFLVITNHTSTKGGLTIRKFYTTIPNALKSVYPEISWNQYKPQSMLKLTFNEITWVFFLIYIVVWIDQKRKQFFDDFAKVNKFDPLNPENWYKVKPTTLWRSRKVLRDNLFLVMTNHFNTGRTNH